MPVEGKQGLFLALFMRVAVKVVTDFTGCIQARAPGELGGLYYAANMFVATTCPLIIVPAVYSRLDGREGPEPSISGSHALRVVGVMSALWWVSAAVVVKYANRSHRSTFWAKMTGKAWTQRYFLEDGSNAHIDSETMKAKIIAKNRNCWGECEPLIGDWVRANWHRCKSGRAREKRSGADSLFAQGSWRSPASSQTTGRRASRESSSPRRARAAPSSSARSCTRESRKGGRATRPCT
jgi:hypothetical protein